jgi:hypothetical protein
LRHSQTFGTLIGFVSGLERIVVVEGALEQFMKAYSPKELWCPGAGLAHP